MKKYQLLLLICLFVLIAVCINFKQYENFRALDPVEDASYILFLKVCYYGLLLFFLSGAGYSVYYMYTFLKNGVASNGKTDMSSVILTPIAWFSMLVGYVLIAPFVQSIVFAPGY